MIDYEDTRDAARVIDGKSYAVRMADDSIEVLKWVIGKGWRRHGRNGFVKGSDVIYVIRSVYIKGN